MYYGADYCDDFDDLISGIENISISSTSKPRFRKRRTRKIQREISQPIQLIRDPKLLKINLYKFSTADATYTTFINEALTYIHLDEDSTEFENVENYFINQKILVLSVKKVCNPYIKKAFELKRHLEYGSIQPQILFHGTKEKYVDNICTYNFNWRFSGCERGHRHGKGVNFSILPLFAANFCDKGKVKVMIIADVLVINTSEGTENLLLPPKGSDTTTGQNGKVLVKFYDNEFCPKYVVQFTKIRNNV